MSILMYIAVTENFTVPVFYHMVQIKWKLCIR
jgi:hypothetical protein